MERVAQNPAGGFHAYEFPKPGQPGLFPKQSYVRTFAPWGWTVGTGIYVDDVDRTIRGIALTMLAGILAIAFATVHWLIELSSDLLKSAIGRAGRLPKEKFSGLLEVLRHGDGVLLAVRQHLHQHPDEELLRRRRAPTLRSLRRLRRLRDGAQVMPHLGPLLLLLCVLRVLLYILRMLLWLLLLL